MKKKNTNKVVKTKVVNIKLSRILKYGPCKKDLLKFLSFACKHRGLKVIGSSAEAFSIVERLSKLNTDVNSAERRSLYYELSDYQKKLNVVLPFHKIKAFLVHANPSVREFVIHAASKSSVKKWCAEVSRDPQFIVGVNMTALLSNIDKIDKINSSITCLKEDIAEFEKEVAKLNDVNETIKQGKYVNKNFDAEDFYYSAKDEKTKKEIVDKLFDIFINELNTNG